MDFQKDGWLGLLPVILFSTVLFLRVRYPKASRRAETMVFGITTALFFGLCYFLLPR
jgi:hypothetical protein